MFTARARLRRANIEKKGLTKMAQARKEKTATELFLEVEDATVELEHLPELLQLLIESYKLDKNGDLTKSEIYNLGTSHRIIFATLAIVRDRLWAVNDKLKAIEIQKDLDQGSAATTK